ncbi:unnamed protein product [Protopolystoma xenopodis]|uniref:Sodium/hydrogen exchanger n=1 Tax=Protopolystoma xenopodis TaxID=117903 RepID=A0A448WBT7_9PLAT|nr:unnamed protein product [Protopolystoma xenopodis]
MNNSHIEHFEYTAKIQAISWQFEEYYIHVTIMVFLMVVILLKMVYNYVIWVSTYIPESLLLICVGVIFGALIRFAQVDKNIDTWQLTPKLFFEFLLPPIVLEAAYSLYNRTFGEFLGTILVYAVLGTVLNFLLIGPVLYGLDCLGVMGSPTLHLDLKGYLLFSSLIVAVDPVAVLAIFQDIGVDLGLYYMVFGESLLNDAVTIVLYQIMQAFAGKEHITGGEIAVGLASFFTVSLGGLLVGVLLGVATCFLTRIYSSMEVIIVLMLGYLAYIMGEVVGWSGIISMIGCGLVQASYAFHNLQTTNVTVVKHISKSVAELSEAVIFLFIGIELFRKNLTWHTGFHLWSLTICLVVRLSVVLLLTAIINWVRVDGVKISMTQQFIVIYGGLRGAVAFSLSVLIRESSLDFSGKGGKEMKSTFITATLFIILFTVGFMGMTMKPLVRLLKIKMHTKTGLSLFNKLNDHIIDQVLAGIETVSGERGRNLVREWCIRVDDRYVRRVLQRDPATHDHKIVKVYEKMALKLHYATIRPDQSMLHLDELPVTIRTKHLSQTMSTHQLASLGSMVNLEELQFHSYAEKIAFTTVPEEEEEEEDGEESRREERERDEHNICWRERKCSTFSDHKELSVEPIEFRSPRRISLLDGGRHQEDFRHAFIELIRSKGLALDCQLRRGSCEASFNKPDMWRRKTATIVASDRPRVSVSGLDSDRRAYRNMALDVGEAMVLRSRSELAEANKLATLPVAMHAPSSVATVRTSVNQHGGAHTDESVVELSHQPNKASRTTLLRNLPAPEQNIMQKSSFSQISVVEDHDDSIPRNSTCSKAQELSVAAPELVEAAKEPEDKPITKGSSAFCSNDQSTGNYIGRIPKIIIELDSTVQSEPQEAPPKWCSKKYPKENGKEHVFADAFQ